MTFEEKLTGLNTNQRLAVETIDGPVMVIAGPGTGKTEILSLRIRRILEQTDTPPGSVLCLTYTDAAANEMRHRLISYIGAAAYQVQVSTFHSFCNLVIRDNPGIFRQARELEPVSDIDRFRILQKLIDSFDENHPLKKFKGLTYSPGKRLHDLFMTMKKENWSPGYMYSQIDAYITARRNSDDYIYKRKSGQFAKGDFNEKKFNEEVLSKMEELKVGVGEYDRYNAFMADEGRYDFEDMLLWVYDAFHSNPDLLANYQERFLYFLVDEFQDTNGIQMDILQKLIDHEWVDRPNVFVVGDDDQAIFRFQGANIENLVLFYQKYTPEVILLEQNYRSSQRILDAARVLMRPVEHSLLRQLFGETKKLSASGAYADHDEPVTVCSYPTLAYENADIFHQVKAWYDQKINGSFAVLYPRHENGRELGQALKGAGIPFRTVRVTDALHHPLIVHLLDILMCIHQLGESPVHDDALLYRVLHLAYLDPRHDDLQRLIIAFTHKNKREDPATLFQWMCDPARLDALALRDRAGMEAKARLLQDAISAYYTQPLSAFVEWTVHRFGLMKWALKSDEKFIHLYALKTFFTFIEQQAAGKGAFRVPDLLDICELMRLYEIRLPVQSLAPPAEGIVLSSLHGAKGLEYEKVVIKNGTENDWEKQRSNTNKFTLPETLARTASATGSMENGQDIQDQDRRRLLYVGMTRAKHDLVLSYAEKNDNGKGLTPSLYLTELTDGHPGIQRLMYGVDEKRQEEYLAALMAGSQRTDIRADHDEIRDRVRNYVLNVSAMNQYLECPVRFYYEKILVIPAAQTSYLLFGSGLHDALQLYFRKRFIEKDTARGKEYLLLMYEFFMDRKRHFFTDKEWNDLVTYGKKALGQFFDTWSPGWSDEIQYDPEYRIQNIHIAGVPVTGFIDRIDKAGNSIVIYDYKSGKTDSFSKKLKRPGDDDPAGGDYWRQMVFYDLMLHEDPKYKSYMDHGYVQALEPDKDDKFVARKVEITQEDRDFVTHQIREVYDKIQGMEFHTGCGECAWCRMHGVESKH